MDVVDIVILGEFRNGEDFFLWALSFFFCFFCFFVIVTIGLTCYMYLYGTLKSVNGEK